MFTIIFTDNIRKHFQKDKDIWDNYYWQEHLIVNAIFKSIVKIIPLYPRSHLHYLSWSQSNVKIIKRKDEV